MTLTDQVFTACYNLGRRKMRFFLASLGVLVGTVTIVLLMSLASGVQQHIHRQFESIGLNRLTIYPSGRFPFGNRGPFNQSGTSGNPKIITPADLERWKSWIGVMKVTPQVNLPGSVNLELWWQDQAKSVKMSDSRMWPGPMGMQSDAPKALFGTLEFSDHGSIVLSQGTVKALGIPDNEMAYMLGQSVQVVLSTSRGESQGFILQVQGISSEKNPTIAVSVSDCIAMKSWWFDTDNLLESEGYDSVTIIAADVSQARALMPRFRDEGFWVQSLDMFLEGANRIVTVITIMLVMIGSVALFVASIGIANTMIMAVYERTREIGILKALGASSSDIRRLFMIEAGFIGLAGGIVGLLAGWAMGVVLNQVIVWFMRFREMPLPQGTFFIITPLLAVGVILFAAFIGVIAGLLPANRASKLDPLEALRHE